MALSKKLFTISVTSEDESKGPLKFHYTNAEERNRAADALYRAGFHVDGRYDWPVCCNTSPEDAVETAKLFHGDPKAEAKDADHITHR